MFLCVIVCDSTPYWPHGSTILNAHGTNASPDGLCTRTHTNEAFSCWFCCKSFRVDRARRGNVCQARQRVFRGMAGPCLKSLERYQVQVPVKRFFYHHTSCRISHPVRLIMNIMWLILYHIPGNSIPSFALPIYKTTCDSKPYLYRSVQYRYLITICVQLASLINDKQHDDNVRGGTVVEEMMKKRWSSGAPVHVQPGN